MILTNTSMNYKHFLIFTNARENLGLIRAAISRGFQQENLSHSELIEVSRYYGIFTDKPFRLKDRIVVSGYDGTVEEIGVRSTRLKTLAGRIVTIPNAKFADAPVENISVEPSRKVVLVLGMTYDTTPDQMQDAMDTLKAINEANDNTEEKTVVAFCGFGDFSLNIKLIYYIKKGSDIAGTESDQNMTILRQFNDKGLEFAFPTQTLYNIQQS